MIKTFFKKNTILLLVFIVLVASSFYWFEYRPTKIRSYCDYQATGDSIKLDGGYQFYYDKCLHEKGLK